MQTQNDKEVTTDPGCPCDPCDCPGCPCGG
jgi:hypothetical protein